MITPDFHEFKRAYSIVKQEAERSGITAEMVFDTKKFRMPDVSQARHRAVRIIHDRLPKWPIERIARFMLSSPHVVYDALRGGPS